MRVAARRRASTCGDVRRRALTCRMMRHVVAFLTRIDVRYVNGREYGVIYYLQLGKFG